MAQPVTPFDQGDVVVHYSGDETFTVVASLPRYTLVVTDDGVDIAYPTGDLTVAASDEALARLRALLTRKI